MNARIRHPILFIGSLSRMVRTLCNVACCQVYSEYPRHCRNRPPHPAYGPTTRKVILHGWNVWIYQQDTVPHLSACTRARRHSQLEVHGKQRVSTPLVGSVQQGVLAPPRKLCLHILTSTAATIKAVGASPTEQQSASGCGFGKLGSRRRYLAVFMFDLRRTLAVEGCL